MSKEIESLEEGHYQSYLSELDALRIMDYMDDLQALEELEEEHGKGVLNNLVTVAAMKFASNVNEKGIESQLTFLVDQGYDVNYIRKHFERRATLLQHGHNIVKHGR